MAALKIQICRNDSLGPAQVRGIDPGPAHKVVQLGNRLAGEANGLAGLEGESSREVTEQTGFHNEGTE